MLAQIQCWTPRQPKSSVIIGIRHLAILSIIKHYPKCQVTFLMYLAFVSECLYIAFVNYQTEEIYLHTKSRANTRNWHQWYTEAAHHAMQTANNVGTVVMVVLQCAISRSRLIWFQKFSEPFDRMTFFSTARHQLPQGLVKSPSYQTT